MDYSDWAPRDVRALISAGKLQGQTSGMCAGYAQANLCILPKAQAFDFLLFCMRNPRPCPILEVGEAGCRQMGAMARGDDVCTAFPKYRIWRAGELVEEVTDISAYWQDDLVYFLIGCSFSFESELLQAGVPVRHIEEGRNVPMFNTNLALEPAGVFHGNMVVSMRPIPHDLVVRSVQVTSAMPPRARRACADWRPGSHRHCRCALPGLRRQCDHSTGRGAGVLALWGNPPGSGDGGQGALCHYPRTGAHAHYRCAQYHAEILIFWSLIYV